MFKVSSLLILYQSLTEFDFKILYIHKRSDPYIYQSAPNINIVIEEG